MTSLGDASRIIDVIDQRVSKATRSGANIEYTWGKVSAVASDGKSASAYLYGETDGAYVSEGFTLPETTYVTVGDAVKVAMDYSTGERWVEEVNVPATAYKKLSFDLIGGKIVFGDGTAAPTGVIKYEAGRQFTIEDTASVGGLGTDIFAQGTLQIRTDRSSGHALLVANSPTQTTNMTFRLSTLGAMEWGSGSAPRDTNLYREGADLLATDDTFRVGGSLAVGSTSDAGHGVDGLKISGGNIEMRNANPFIDFKTTDIDYGARIIYDLNYSDGLEFYGAAAGYYFDSDIRTTGDLVVGGNDIYFGSASGHRLYAHGNGVGLILAGVAKPLKAGGILVSNSYSDPDPNIKGIQFGSDVNLYWSAANVLKTDDALVVGGKLTAGSVGDWITTGFSAASGFSITTSRYRVLMADIVEVLVYATYSGATLTGSARGNITDTPMCTLPSGCRPTNMLPITIEGSIAFFGGTLNSSGVVSLNEINGSGAYFESGDTARFHAIFSTSV